MTSDDGGPQPTDLRVDRRPSPSDVDPDTGPRFSWTIDDPTWGDCQTGYRVRLAESVAGLDDAPLWDSGVVDSERSIDVRYEGPALSPDSTYHWTVTVRNDDGEFSAAAEPTSFTTATDDAWAGEWIAAQPDGGDSNGYRSRWRDPADDPTEWVGVDLGAAREVAAVELHPAEPFAETKTPDGRTITSEDTEETYRDATVAQGPVAFGFPDRYRIEVADDSSFSDATVVVDRTDADVDDPRRDPVHHELGDDRRGRDGDGERAGRYVRMVATSLDAYEASDDDDRFREARADWSIFALASLAVRDADGEDLARGQPVTASASVETETWSREKLTDGHRTSEMTGTSPLFRAEFELEKPVATARARFAGLGYGELYVNGERAGDRALDPAWTQYDERVLYSTIDVGDRLEPGTNALGIWLGRGWFARSARHWQAVGSPRARLELHVEYADGTTTTLSTGPDWRTAPSPIVANDIYDGETYDARREQPGWAEPGFDDGDWEQAAVATPPGGSLEPQRTDPIRVTETLEPVGIRDHPDGPIVDFGQNHTGWLAVDIDGGEIGDEVVLRHAEALDEDGGLRTVDLRTADATDTFVIGEREGADEKAGERSRTYEPRFTYHGYRYAQIIGYPGELTVDDVRSRVVHTDFDSDGEFSCSNEDLNAVQRNARWGLRTNAHGVPTDCPQRDERLGFTGDGHIAGPALQYNFDAGRFHRKWFRDHLDVQSEHGYVPSKCPHGALPAMADPSWTVSMLAVPWHVYQFDGDRGLLEAHYSDLRRYVEFWESAAEDDLLPEVHEGYGDWVALENLDGRYGEPRDFFTNAYYHRSVDLLAKIAEVIDLEDQARHYRERADAIAAVFNDRYFDADAAAYEDRTQATYALPVFFGIAPDERVDEIVANLARKVIEEDDRSLRTGFLGTRPLLSVLSEHGHANLAYEIVSRSEFPGWVYQVRQGATTVWERWDSDSDEHVGGRMNSLNHSPFALVSEWFYEHLAGIDVGYGGDGWQASIEPSFVDDLDHAAGSVDVPPGTVSARWERTDGAVELTVSIPWNVNGRLSLSAARDDVTIDRNGTERADVDDVTVIENGDGGTEFAVPPGTWTFRVE